MRVSFSSGFNTLLLIILLSVLILALISMPLKRFVFISYTHLTDKIGININNIASAEYVKWIKSQNGTHENSKKAVFLNNDVSKSLLSNRGTLQDLEILGESSNPNDAKWILVDISDQKLYMKENDNTVGQFLVSTGKWYPTPRGEWRIWTKLRATRMEGGSKELGTYYNLPNVPYTMYYDRGYGIHGAYWHNNFGNPMSHGCTNMKPEEAAIVFNWAPQGTRVVVQD